MFMITLAKDVGLIGVHNINRFYPNMFVFMGGSERVFTHLLHFSNLTKQKNLFQANLI